VQTIARSSWLVRGRCCARATHGRIPIRLNSVWH